MNAVAGSGVILQRARVQPGMAVLDVGAGPGRLSVPAAQRVGPEGRVVAFDVQPAMLALLHEAKAAAGVTNLQAVLGEAGKGSLPPGPFDRVLLVTVLGEIADQRGALAEIFKLLKPGGLLSVTEVLPDPHYQSRTRVRRLAEGAGFEVTEVVGPWYAFTMNLRKPVAA
jgi:ubiquinone/menaquinone biosynthesis C-methylase UbiE